MMHVFLACFEQRPRRSDCPAIALQSRMRDAFRSTARYVLPHPCVVRGLLSLFLEVCLMRRGDGGMDLVKSLAGVVDPISASHLAFSDECRLGIRYKQLEVSVSCRIPPSLFSL